MNSKKEHIARVLKEYRKISGLTSKDVTSIMESKGIKISNKTLYGWESGHSQPDADKLLILCEIYNIKNIMKVFEYDNNRYKLNESAPISCDNSEKSNLIKKIDLLDSNSCKIVSAYIDGLLTEKKDDCQ
jgi:transcriptional regulator with XRE-family HTH domain